MIHVAAQKLRLDEPTPDQVRQQLDQILNSDDFGVSERGRRFLGFIVNEKLNGRAIYIKAFTIAQAVFGRDVSFDAQNDPCVRIEAGRIRRELEHYYLLNRSPLQILISVPKGTYVPMFQFAGDVADPETTCSESGTFLDANEDAVHRRRDRRWIVAAVVALAAFSLVAAILYPSPRANITDSAKNGSVRPVVAVEEFLVPADNPTASKFSQWLRYDLVEQLVSLNQPVVMTNMPARGKRGAPLGDVYRLEGSVIHVDGRFRIAFRLVRDVDGAVVSAKSYDLTDQPTLDTQSALASEIVSVIRRPLGTVSAPDQLAAR